MNHLNLKLLVFVGILPVLKFEFLKFRILETLNFHPCKYISVYISAMNPFASTSPNSTNPFEQPTQRVPLSQLQASTYNSGFTQPVSQGLLPAPMAPMAPMTMPQPMQPQQGYNPFLWE